MRDYNDNVPTSSYCEPNYAEQFVKLKEELENFGCKITLFETPEPLRKFYMSVNYEERKEDPYNIIIPDHFYLWQINDMLDDYKSTIKEIQRESARKEEIKELAKELGL